MIAKTYDCSSFQTPGGQPENATPSQMLYDQIMNSQGRPPPMGSAALQRSRSLGRDSTPTHIGGGHLPPRAPPGSRTPTSVARKVLESVTKRLEFLLKAATKPCLF